MNDQRRLSKLIYNKDWIQIKHHEQTTDETNYDETVK